MVPNDSAWPEIQEWIDEASNSAKYSSPDPNAARGTLAGLPSSTERSILGALTVNTTGLLIEEWLLVLGAGGDGYPSITDFNGQRADLPGIPGALIAAVDVMGGAFAINGGGLTVCQTGQVAYLAPDTLDWVSLDRGHGDFVHWALNADLNEFCGGLRFPGWQTLAAALHPGQGISAYPFPWSTEGQGPDVSRRAVPLTEVHGVLLATIGQIP